jgi:hypothetical protein
MKGYQRLALSFVVLASAGSPALAQVEATPPPRAMAFPPSLSVMVGVGTYGPRAARDSIGTLQTRSLTTGPILTARLQAPFGRRFGLQVGGGVTRRSRREDRNGAPFFSQGDHVVTLRAEGGLLFRFKPAAPIYFGGSFVYVRHGAPPVINQVGGVTTETGGGFGVGVDFGRKPGSSFAGRIEYWNYFVKPSAGGLTQDFLARSRAHDTAVTIGVTYRMRARAGRGS